MPTRIPSLLYLSEKALKSATGTTIKSVLKDITKNHKGKPEQNGIFMII